MMQNQEIQAVLGTGEKISWRGVVNRTVIGINLVLSLIVFLIISGLVYSTEIISYSSGDLSKTINGATVASLILIFGFLLSLIISLSNLSLIHISEPTRRTPI